MEGGSADVVMRKEYELHRRLRTYARVCKRVYMCERVCVYVGGYDPGRSLGGRGEEVVWVSLEPEGVYD